MREHLIRERSLHSILHFLNTYDEFSVEEYLKITPLFLWVSGNRREISRS